MWRIRIDKLYTEVGGLISGAEVVFRSPGAEKKVEGKLTEPDSQYVFDMAGGRGVLEIDQGDRVVMEFEVLISNDEPLPTGEAASEAGDPQPV